MSALLGFDELLTHFIIKPSEASQCRQPKIVVRLHLAQPHFVWDCLGLYGSCDPPSGLGHEILRLEGSHSECSDQCREGGDQSFFVLVRCQPAHEVFQ